MQNNYDKKPKQFRYWVDKEGRTSENTLELAICDNNYNNDLALTENSIIIRDELLPGYMLFSCYEHFANHYSECTLHLTHECIYSHQKQKIKIDIDKLPSEDIIDDICFCLLNVFLEIYEFEAEIVVCLSLGIGIISAHLIIVNCCVANSREADWFTRKVLVPSLGDLAKYIDIGVNKPKQTFRTAYSTKEGRQKIPNIGYSRKDCMITIVNGLIVLPLKAPPEVINDRNIIPVGEITFDVDKYIDRDVWILGKVRENRYEFNRLKTSHCAICDREHTRENMFVCVFPNCARMFCRRDTTKNILLYEIEEDFTSLYFGDYGKFAGKFPKLDQIIAWIRSNIVFVVNGGNSYYITRDVYNGRITYDIVKTLRGSLPKITYQNPKYDKTDDKSKPYITEALSKILSRVQSAILYKWAEFIPYSPIKPALQTADIFNTFSGFEARYNAELIIDTTLVQPWLDHIMNILANGKANIAEYIISWLAQVVQNPAKKIGTSLVFKSEQGAGKGIIFNFLIEYVFGEHISEEIKDIEQLIGRFNCAIENKVLIVCDEIQNYGGAYKSNDRLKGMITQKKQRVERKGIDSKPVTDYCNYVFLTNNDWVVKVEMSDRRYVVIETSNKKINDHAYFDMLGALVNKETGMHLYNWLLRYDIKINLGKIPSTEMRNELKLNSVPPEIIWLIKILAGENAQIVCGDMPYSGAVLYQNFIEWAQRSGYQTRIVEQTFLRDIGKLVERRRIWIDNQKVSRYFIAYDLTLDNIRGKLKLPEFTPDDIH